MELKRFKQISDKILKDYGFIKKGTAYFLILPDMQITLKLGSHWQKKAWIYSVSIHALHSEDTPIEERFDTYAYAYLEHSKHLRGSDRFEILFEEYSEEFYVKMFTKMLHNEFDCYKECGIEYLKNNCLYYLFLKDEARNYVGTTENRDFVGTFLSNFDAFTTGLDTEHSNYYERNGEIEYIIYVAHHCVRIIWDKERETYRIEVERRPSGNAEDVICITKSSKYKDEVAEYIRSQNLDVKSLRDHASYLAKILPGLIKSKINICTEYSTDLDVDGIPIQYL